MRAVLTVWVLYLSIILRYLYFMWVFPPQHFRWKFCTIYTTDSCKRWDHKIIKIPVLFLSFIFLCSFLKRSIMPLTTPALCNQPNWQSNVCLKRKLSVTESWLLSATEKYNHLIVFWKKYPALMWDRHFLFSGVFSNQELILPHQQLLSTLRQEHSVLTCIPFACSFANV